ncbi:HNH endonuclease [Saccharothrix hoggarensis]|uniref:HNH endonuclease n=1 Tax=Saccharothrix hoggarensis TaxID=913853 RepID=A0ABW3R0A2_9PSEU
MSYRDVREQDVLAAIARFDELGGEAFLERYGYDKARRFVLVHNGKQYDSKAIVGVAHEFLDGRALTPDEFSGGRATVGRRLGALGFVVQERGALPQLLLQPRGGARDGGPQNFKRTVEEGIRLDDHAEALGADLAELRALYRDGTARLWGNTPPAKSNNPKAKAIRGRRVGDRVLFYAERTFIAEAVILKLFHNPAAARSIWGVDQTGATFEHMMALGDVTLIRRDATDLVLRTTGQETLRSVTLVPADVEPPAGPVAPPPPPDDGPVSAEEFLTRLLTLHGREQAAKRDSVALLWTIGQVHRKPRLHPWSTFRQEVAKVLTTCGLEGADELERPFYDLRRTGFWRVVPESAAPGAADAEEPSAGFTDESHRLLVDVAFRTKAINVLRSRHLDGEDHEVLLASVGLEDYATASGEPRSGGRSRERRLRPNTGSSVARDREVVRRVKALHDHTCQFCHTRLNTGFGYYSEAAHIRGLTVHKGPDELENLLCLCANCHVQFDGFGLYVDEGDVVRRVRDRGEVGKLRRVSGHAIEDAHIAYHRDLCVIAPSND